MLTLWRERPARLISCRFSEAMRSFEGKVVIVTGASRGIGAALVPLLRERGAALTLASRRRPDGGDLNLECDVTLEEARVRLIETALDRFGRIDCLINNAGRGSYHAPSEAPLDDAHSLFELNFFAPLRLAQLATPYLRKARGSLVNVGSIAGQIALPWLPVYSASKFALASITSAQRMELRRDGVHVMGVFPGYVDTGFQAHAAGSAPPSRVVQGRRFAISAAACARAIVAGIERRRETVVTPRAGWLLIWLNRAFPSVVEARLGGS